MSTAPSEIRREMRTDKRHTVYRATKTLAAFHRSSKFVRGVMGPFGSGKSTAMCQEIVALASAQTPHNDGVRRTKCGVIRNTYPQLTSTTIETWKEWFPADICPIVYSAPITGRFKFPLPDGTSVHLIIHFVSLDRPEDVAKLLSLELSFAWANEARELPKAIIDALTGRVGRYPRKVIDSETGEVLFPGCTRSCIFMDTNPPPDDHWWYELAEQERPYNYEFFRQPSALTKCADGSYKANLECENVENLSDGYNYWYRQLSGKTPEWIKVYIMGQYGSVFEGKPVYKDLYDDTMHVSPVPLGVYRNLPLLLGWDFGLTPACIVCQVTPRGTLHVLREHNCDRGGIRQFANDIVNPALANEYAGMKTISIGDPAGDSNTSQVNIDEVTCIEELNNLGFPTTAAPTNDFILRRQAVVSFLTKYIDKRPGLLLDPSIHVLRKGFNGGYHYDRVQVTGEERYRDIPNKNRFSHIHDALQYICLRIDKPLAGVPGRHSGMSREVGSMDGWV